MNFTNDKFTDNKLLKKNFLPTTVGNNVLIGTGSTILPIKIENNVTLGAGSVITKNCKKIKFI